MPTWTERKGPAYSGTMTVQGMAATAGPSTPAFSSSASSLTRHPANPLFGRSLAVKESPRRREKKAGERGRGTVKPSRKAFAIRRPRKRKRSHATGS